MLYTASDPVRVKDGVAYGRTGFLLTYIAIIVGPSAAALSGAQNSDFPQRKSALNLNID